MAEISDRAGIAPASDLGAPAEVRQAARELLPLFYDEVRRMAHRERRRAGAYTGVDETLQTTALIHEAYLRMRGSGGFNDHAHFLRAAALAMRHVLIDYARERLADKRGGGVRALPLDAAEEVGTAPDEHLLEVDAALARLAALNPRLAQIVECRFFAGYDENQTAQALGIADRTVRRDWVKARAWLRVELGRGGGATAP
jgi:RNA polymerase sigma factor (TIGR02999 family)